MADKHEEAHHQQDPKAKVAGAAAGAGVLAKTWHVFNRPNGAAAVTWLNSPPAQQAGEAFAAGLPNGTVDAYAFF